MLLEEEKENEEEEEEEEEEAEDEEYHPLHPLFRVCRIGRWLFLNNIFISGWTFEKSGVPCNYPAFVCSQSNVIHDLRLAPSPCWISQAHCWNSYKKFTQTCWFDQGISVSIRTRTGHQFYMKSLTITLETKSSRIS